MLSWLIYYYSDFQTNVKKKNLNFSFNIVAKYKLHIGLLNVEKHISSQNVNYS
jgi:hypothetical protein